MWKDDTEHLYTVRTGFLDLRGRGGIQCFTPLSHGEVAQMAERSLSMREVRGSIPCFSTFEVLAQNWNWIFFIFWRGKDETIGDTVRITLLSWITDSSLCAHLSATHQLIIIHD